MSATLTIKVKEITFEMVTHYDQDTEPTDFECYSEEEIQAWNNDEWHFVGIQTVAHITIEDDLRGGRSFRLMTLEGPSLWGIDSESTDYHSEVFADLTREFKAILGLPEDTQ